MWAMSAHTIHDLEVIEARAWRWRPLRVYALSTKPKLGASKESEKMPHHIARAWWIALVAFGVVVMMSAPEARAQGVASEPGAYVPPALQPWVPWVMASHTETGCAQIGAGFVCDWPGEVTLTVDQAGGSFTQRVFVGRRQQVLLPGGGRFWPQQVRVGLEPATVRVSAAGRPAVELGRGEHFITGTFEWSGAPEVVTLPEHTGRVVLTYLGERIARPRFDEQGRLWIREASPESQSEADSLRVSTYRRLRDGVPLEVTTRLELNVAGRAREVSLGDVLLEGTRPVRVDGGLPVQISATGEVKAYVRPGTHVLEVVAYITSPRKKIQAPPRPSPSFDPQEIWVWEPKEALRSVELSGLMTIDPGRTTLPEEWRGATTLRARPEQTLELKATRRGEQDTPPNQLRLRRQMWLDLDGQGYTVKDTLEGQLHRGWRINYGEGAGKLGRVQKVSSGDDLLITADPDAPQLEGVELREQALQLEAEVRMEQARAELPVVGWSHDVQNLEAELYLPPGWSVLAARGVDQLDGTWVDSWDLFEFFVLLMIAFAMGKLFGWPWGVISGVAMILSHGQAGAPRYVWFHLVAVLALLRVLPDKPWLRYPALTYLGVSFVSLVVILGSYTYDQIHHGIYPQVANRASHVKFGGGDKAPSSAAFSRQMDSVEQEVSFKKRGADYRGKFDSARQEKKVKNEDWLAFQQQVDPNEVVQTGPGLPDWEWSAWSMRWKGPVARGHTIELWLISPAWNFALRMLSVIVFILMALVVLAPGRLAQGRGEQFDLLERLRRLAVPGLALALGGALLAAPTGAQAQSIPNAPVQAQVQEVSAPNRALAVVSGGEGGEVLEELEHRLLQERQCEGPCVVVPQVTITIEGQSMEVQAQVHAQRDSAWALPGPPSVAPIEQVRLDGQPTRQLRREPGGLAQVRVPAGIHTVRLRARLVGQNVITLQLGERARPRHVSLRAPEWAVDGLDEYGRPDNSLQLSRRERESGEQAAPAAGGSGALELPPWYFVERTLMLSMPWQTRTVITRERSERPQLVKIPLLPGEAVITEGVRVEDGEALVQFPRGASSVNYTSELKIPSASDEQAAELVLEAPQGQPWTETWKLECSRIWRCGFEGIAPIRTIVAGNFAPVWQPWPGEAVQLKVRKPRGAEGAASTVTRVDYKVTPGQRRLQATLTIKARASQGGWQSVTLPEAAELQSVTIDGAARNIRPEGQKVALPLKPGAQTFVLTWMQPWERSLVETFPPVDVGSEAANVHMALELDDQRWLLWAFGPRWGPAVLFWSNLLLLLIIAGLFGRLEHLPLRTHHWLLLALGMSQLPMVLLLVLVVWFTLLVWREQRPPENWALFDLFQLVILGATFVALILLYAAVHTNLLLDVDMQVSGMGSSNTMLRWYTDRVTGELPRAGVVSVPLLVWRGAMLVWALWLVNSLVKWLSWAWECFSDGGLWRMAEPTPPPSGSSQRQVSRASVHASQDADGTPGATPAQERPQPAAQQDRAEGAPPEPAPGAGAPSPGEVNAEPELESAAEPDEAPRRAPEASQGEEERARGGEDEDEAPEDA